MTESCRLITEQYQEYLKLKAEHKPLSWKELKEEAKKMGYCETKSCIKIDGEIVSDESIKNEKIQLYNNGMVLCEHLNCDQMLAIMKALQ